MYMWKGLFQLQVISLNLNLQSAKTGTLAVHSTCMQVYVKHDLLASFCKGQYQNPIVAYV